MALVGSISGSDGLIGVTGSMAVTGSMIVTGSLIVSSSSTFTSYGPSVFSGSVRIITGSIGDDVRILAPTRITGTLDADMGLSGSHTKLSDGTSAFIAGTNVTITSASNGAVTISATGGGGGSIDGSGATNRVAVWSDVDTLTSDADLSWNGTTLDVQGDANLNGTVVINQSGVSKDFRVETANKTAAIQTDGSTDQVMILSGTTSDSVGVGSSGQDPDPRTFTDTNLFVSGAKGSRGTGRKGTAVFGGDAVISGSIVSHQGLSGSHTKLSDGTSAFIAGANVTITSASNGAVTIAAAGGGGSIDGSGAASRIAYWSDSDTLTSDADLTFDGNTLTVNKSLIVNNAGGNNDFRVESQNKSTALLVDANQDRVLILSGGDSLSPNEADHNDVAFYVSGSIGNRNSSLHKGSSVFGGDVIVSGSLSVGTGSAGIQALNVYGNADGKFVAFIDNNQSSNGHVLKLQTDGNGSGSRLLEMKDGDGDTLFRARADGRFGFGPNGVSSMGAGTFVVGIDGGHSADIAISKRLQHLGDSNTYIDFPGHDQVQVVAGGMDMISMIENAMQTKMLILSGGSGQASNPALFQDTNFHVSGALGSRGLQRAGTAVFGGDLLTSGTMYVSGAIRSVGNGFQNYLQFHSGHGKSFKIVAGDSQILTRDAAGTPDAITLNQDGHAISAVWKVNSKFAFGSLASSNQVLLNADTGAEAASDVQIWLSGSRDLGGFGGKDKNGVILANGDTVVSGALYLGGRIYNEGNNQSYIRPSTNRWRIVATNHEAIDVNYSVTPKRIRINGDRQSNLEVRTLNKNYALMIDNPNDRVLILSGGSAQSPNEAMAADVSFYVSGSAGSMGGSNKGTAVFGGDVFISGSLGVKQQHITTHKFKADGNTKRWVRFDMTGSESQADIGQLNHMVAAYPGRLTKVKLRSTQAGGNTQVGLHVSAGSAASLPSSYMGTSQTVNMSSANTTYTFNFTEAENWAEDDILGLSVNPTVDPGTMSLTAVWEFSIES